MLISLHKRATTPPKIRAAIEASTHPAWMIAERYGISGQTVWRWSKRDSVHDLWHTLHRLQTTLSPAQEAVAVTLRTTLLLPLDDLLAVVREFLNPHVSRSGFDRCLRRHGVGNLRELKPKEAKPTHSSFMASEPGYLHMDITYLPHPLGALLHNALPGSGWRMRTGGVTSLSPSIGRPAGSLCASIQYKPLPMRAVSCVTWRAALMKITRVLTDNVLCRKERAV